MLYHLLAGSVPFPGDTLFAALHGHISLPPPKPSDAVPSLPGGLDEVVARAMAKDPADRYPTRRALAVAARAALVGPPPVPSTPPRSPAPPTVIQDTTPSSVPLATVGDRHTVLQPDLPGHAHPARAHGRLDLHPPSPGQDGGGPVPPPPGYAPPAPPPHHRRTGAVVAVAVVLVATVALVSVLLLDRSDGTRDDAIGGGAVSAGPTTGSGTGSPATTSTAVDAALAALPRAVDPLPDSAVVVAPNDGPGQNLFVVDSSTGDATQLTSGADDEHSPVLSPDRRTLAYLSTGADGSNELLAMPADGGAAQPLVEPLPGGCSIPLRPAWDPADPTRVALPCGNGTGARTLQVLTLDGAVVSTPAVGAFFGDVAFSPDGSEIAYWGATAAGTDGGSLWSISADGSGQPRQITDSADRVDADPVWSSAGIAFRRAYPDGSRSICVVQADDSDVQVLTEGGYDEDPAWSPDASRIVYKSREDAPDGRTRMWTLAADGSDAQPLDSVADDVDEQSEPAWGNR